LRDGKVVRAEVDLPAGSLAAPTCDAVLRSKFLHETTSRLSADAAARAYQTGLDLDRATVADFVAQVCIPPRWQLEG